ncbi:MAG: tubulin-like doman-containing protein [Haloferacaceae archaeon]
MVLPDKVFAVGGAGKEITKVLLQQDWIQEEIVRPRPDPLQVDVTIIDTAEGELNTDKNDREDIKDEIAQKKDELRDHGRGRTGNVNITYKNIADEIQLTSQVDLTGPSQVERIAEGNGMREEDWWISGDYIDQNLDFARGVTRRRGLGKAIYYKAYAEDRALSDAIDLPRTGKVAIVVGLGGGTGSGIFVDLAQHIKKMQPTAEVTLFGVLPNEFEGNKENANAFAALSEVERLALENENVFENVVLLPIEPTEYGGKKGDTISSEQSIQRFDEAASYLIAAYYSDEGVENPFEDTPSYAPFTIGIPQVLRYNTEAISEAREELAELVEEKREMHDAEEKVYDQLTRFLDRNYPDADGAGLLDEDEEDLSERLEMLEQLLEVDLFTELDYESVNRIRAAVESGRERDDSVAAQLRIMNNEMSAHSRVEAGVDSLDERLDEVLRKEIALANRRRELLERQNAVDDSRIQEAIGYLLRPWAQQLNAGVHIDRLETTADQHRERKAELEEELQEVETRIETQRSQQREEVDRRVNEWAREVEGDFDRYEELSAVDFDRLLDRLEAELDSYRTQMSNVESLDDLEAVSDAEVMRALNELTEELERLGIHFDDRQAIEDSVMWLESAREAALKRQQEESTVEQLLPWESSTKEEIQEAQKRFQQDRAKLDNAGVFGVARAVDFNADLVWSPDSVRSRIERERGDLRGGIADALRAKLDGQPPREFDDFQRRLEDGDGLEQLRDLATDVVEADLAGGGELEEERDRIEAELDSTVEQLEAYDAATELFQGSATRFEERRTEFGRLLGDYLEGGDRLVTTTDDDEYAYIKNIKPNNVFRATGESDLADTNLFQNVAESQRLRDNLEELIGNVQRERYNGLRRRRISHREHGRYQRMNVRVAVLSKAIPNVDNENLEFENTFREAFGINSQQYMTWKDEIGGPWDVSLSVFIDGCFLDNVKKVVVPDGYRDGYRDRLEGDDPTLLHHSLYLENGEFARREEMLNLEDPEDVRLLLSEEAEVTGTLRDELSRRSPVAEIEESVFEGESQ